MQNNMKVLVAAALVVALLAGGIAGAREFTISDSLNGEPVEWGDTIKFSGTADTNLSKDTDGVYIFLSDANGDMKVRSQKGCGGLRFDYESPIIVPSGGEWSYVWDTGEKGCKYPPDDMTIEIEAYQISDGKVDSESAKSFKIDIIAIPTPPPTPTEDYSAKIAALETKVSEQNNTIATLATVKKKETINFTARMEDIERDAAIQRAKNEEQDNFILKIMKFLGLA